MNEQFASVWDAIEDTPERANEMKQRSELMIGLEQYIRQMSQTEAATLLGVTKTRVSALRRGKFSLFSLDDLVELTSRVGLGVGESGGSENS